MVFHALLTQAVTVLNAHSRRTRDNIVKSDWDNMSNLRQKACNRRSLEPIKQ